MKCPVCKTECSEKQECPQCGFSELLTTFINQDDANSWLLDVVEPYRKKYLESLQDWTIEDFTLKRCNIKGKKKVVVPYGVKIIAHDGSCDSKATEIVLPNTIKQIEPRTFAHKNIERINIPEGVEEIGEYAFNSCPIKSVVLPSSIRFLGDHCFSAEYITLSDGNENYYIKNKCLIEKATGKLLFVSDKSATRIVIPDEVKSIGVYSFSHCSQLESLIIPDGVETIMRGAFFRCDNLKSIVFPSSIKIIERYVVEQCYKLRNIYCDFYEEDVDLDKQWLDACCGLANLSWKNEWILINNEPYSLG